MDLVLDPSVEVVIDQDLIEQTSDRAALIEFQRRLVEQMISKIRTTPSELEVIEQLKSLWFMIACKLSEVPLPEQAEL